MLDLRQVDINKLHETLELMRLQLGWSKRQLASETGFSYKRVRIWIDTGYETASYSRIKKVFQVMKQALEQQTQP
jgi:predicted transcriptional regulator